ncbi:MAG TPA: hotdog domain-containing protein [Acidimicrobiales bacterium]|nr:hotdog domain-containing protein [Acidimicrobiales bacterium]
MLNIGMTGSADLVVTAADTAAALGSGTVDVLGTPRVVALVEAAAVEAVTRALAPGETTVGTRIELDHLRPTAVGRRVVAHAEIAALAGRRVTFNVHATDDEDVLIARGIHTRAVVDAARFAADATA